MNPFALVADPPAVVTITFLAPAVPAGVIAVIDEALATTLVADLPSMATVAPVRFVPAMVIAVPPASGPELGVTEAMVGAAI